MDPAKELAGLALQKRMLLAESEAQRLVLAAELHRVITPLRWMDRVQSQVRPLLLVVAPFAGFWLTRRSRGMTRWLTAGFGAMRLVRTLRRMIPRAASK
jgi:hypothetical protein